MKPRLRYHVYGNQEDWTVKWAVGDDPRVPGRRHYIVIGKQSLAGNPAKETKPSKGG